MTPTRFLAAAVIGLVALVAAPAAKSAAVHWAIEAEVTEVKDIFGLLGGALAVGDALAGDVRFDDAAVNVSPLPTVGRYGHASAPWGLELHAGGLSFASDSMAPNFWVQVINDLNSHDMLSFIEYKLQPLAGGLRLNHLFIELEDQTMTALSDIGIPAQPPALADYATLRRITITGCSTQAQDGCNEFIVKADVMAISVAEEGPGAPLPAPPTLALAGLGALAAFVTRRRTALLSR